MNGFWRKLCRARFSRSLSPIPFTRMRDMDVSEYFDSIANERPARAGILYYDPEAEMILSTRSGDFLAYGGGLYAWRHFDATNTVHVRALNRMLKRLAEENAELREANDVLRGAMAIVAARVNPFSKEAD